MNRRAWWSIPTVAAALALALALALAVLPLAAGASPARSAPVTVLSEGTSFPPDQYEAGGDDDPAQARDITSRLTHDSQGEPVWPAEPYEETHTISRVESQAADIDWFRFDVTDKDLADPRFSVMIDAVDGFGGVRGAGHLSLAVEVFGPYAEATQVVAATPPGEFGAVTGTVANSYWHPPFAGGSAEFTSGLCAVRHADLPGPGTYWFRVRPDYFTGYLGAAGPYRMRFKIGQATRLAGNDRVATAVRVADEGWSDASEAYGSRVPTAVVACSTRFPDALAASSLAAALGSPVLLVPPDSVPDDVLDLLRRKGTRAVDLVGGTAAIGQAVEDRLTAEGLVVKRIAGPDRIATAIEVAREARRAGWTYDSSFAIVAHGYDFPDALAATPFSYARRVPILLTHRDHLDAAVSDAIGKLGIRNVVLVGGPAAVDRRVETSLAARLGGGSHVYRVAGVDRYDTAVRFALWATDQLGPGQRSTASVGTVADPEALSALDHTHVGFASGQDFPDALAGGPLMGGMSPPGTLLLVRRDTIPPVVFGGAGLLNGQTSYFDGFPLMRSYVFGGPAAISTGTMTAIDRQTGWGTR